MLLYMSAIYKQNVIIEGTRQIWLQKWSLLGSGGRQRVNLFMFGRFCLIHLTEMPWNLRWTCGWNYWSTNVWMISEVEVLQFLFVVVSSTQMFNVNKFCTEESLTSNFCLDLFWANARIAADWGLLFFWFVYRFTLVFIPVHSKKKNLKYFSTWKEF